MALRKLASQFACTTGLRVGISPALQACREGIWRSFATGEQLAATRHRPSSVVEPPCGALHLPSAATDCHTPALVLLHCLACLYSKTLWSPMLAPGNCSSHAAPHVCMLAAAVSEDRKYASSHEWAKVDGDVAAIGISDFAQVLPLGIHKVSL